MTIDQAAKLVYGYVPGKEPKPMTHDYKAASERTDERGLIPFRLGNEKLIEILSTLNDQIGRLNEQDRNLNKRLERVEKTLDRLQAVTTEVGPFNNPDDYDEVDPLDPRVQQ